MIIDPGYPIERISPMEIQTTKHERELLDHAVGERKTTKNRKAKNLKDCFRNYFAASPDSDDDILWQGLVAKGLAVLVGKPREWLPHNTYSVTEAGFKELG